MTFFLGLDLGAAFTKSCIINDDKEVVAVTQVPSGIHFKNAGTSAIQSLLKQTKLERNQIKASVACGYGRQNISADSTKTEIACHSKSIYQQFGGNLSILDIGGKDTKLIHLDAQGRVNDFQMNQNCASGTGTFLEEMARRMQIPLSQMNTLAESADHIAPFTAYCTVFAGNQLLEAAQNGTPASAVAGGVFHAMIDRALDTVGMIPKLILTGGVAAHNPYFCRQLALKIKGVLSVAPLSQYTGAVGAALFATEL